ncbi:DUF962 domain-containing protein [Cryomorphaceae bacterium]|nr:DUF962 domain-containing protein [Cryomorphaceae bacterium]
MAERVYKSFKEFYPYYLTEHSKRGTRITHFIGTSLFILLVLYSLVMGNGWLFLMGVVLAYGWAWIGHFFIEKNKPATFQYPLWSLASDFKLYFQILGGKEGFTAK